MTLFSVSLWEALPPCQVLTIPRVLLDREGYSLLLDLISRMFIYALSTVEVLKIFQPFLALLSSCHNSNFSYLKARKYLHFLCLYFLPNLHIVIRFYSTLFIPQTYIEN